MDGSTNLPPFRGDTALLALGQHAAPRKGDFAKKGGQQDIFRTLNSSSRLASPVS
jgi:hypothetical protein